MTSPSATCLPTSSAELRDPVFDRPVFIVSPPRSGSTLLFETLMRAEGVQTIGGESHQLIETIPSLNVATRGWSSNTLAEDDATPSVAAELRRRFRDSVRDRTGRAPSTPRMRLLEKTPKNSLRIPFFAKVFPEAHFVLLHRAPRDVLASMIEAWQSGFFQTYRDLPGWHLPAWSLLLTPGWRSSIGQRLPDIVAAQWNAVGDALVAQLGRLAPDRWTVVRYERLIADPAAEVSRLCAALDYRWDGRLEATLPLSRHTLTPPEPDKWKRHADAIASILPSVHATADRMERLIDEHQGNVATVAS